MGIVFKKISMLNKNLVHLIDDIYWTKVFKTKTQAEKVVAITHNRRIISNMSIMSLVLNSS